MDVAQKIKLVPLVTDDPEVSLDHPASKHAFTCQIGMLRGKLSIED